MTEPFSNPYQVMYFDTDCGGVVHNLAYLRWVEECRTKMALHIGIDFMTLANEEKIFTVVVRHEVDYHCPAVMADKIITSGYLENAEKSSLWFRFEIRREHDNKKLVSVRQRLALVKMPSGRPTRIPEEWKSFVYTPPAE